MEDGMEKRLLMSFALSILVLIAYGWLFPPQEPAVGPDTSAPVAVTDTAPPETVPPAGDLDAPGSQGAEEFVPAAQGNFPGEAAVSSDAVTVQADFIQDITVDTAVYSVRFSNQGGVLQSIRLREYDDGTGQMLELINPEAGAATGWPLAIVTGDPQINDMVANALFVVRRDGTNIQMEYAADGLSVRKEFRFDAEAYTFEVDAQVERDGSPVSFSFVWQGQFGEQGAGSGVPFSGSQESNIVYRDSTSFERLSAADIESPNDVPATTYVGVEDRYFLAMFLLPDARPPTVRMVSVDLGDDELEPTGRIEVPHLGDPIALYVGPQQRQRLAAVDNVLAAVIDYGIFGVLSRPMMYGLFVIHGYVGNWGWAIIILTIFINFAFFPLRLKQQLSMQKMQKIQPQMRTLQDKMKKLKGNDPRKPEVQAEMMGLYKKHGVNPLGSCLPMLLQMPFLIAIFWALQVSVELRQAPWMWILDLAAPEPSLIKILPILFGVSMFVQQKTMPTSADPMQARIMMIMPPMLTALFYGYPSGLMLYWLTSNLFGVGQQFLIRKYWAPAGKPKRTAPPAPVEANPVIEAEDVSASEEDDSSEPKRRKHRRKK